MYLQPRSFASVFAEHCLNFSVLPWDSFFLVHLHKSSLSRSCVQIEQVMSQYLSSFFVNNLEKTKNQSTLYLCCCGSIFPELLTCNDKMVPSLQGSISETKQEVAPTQRLQKEKSRSYFSLGHEGTKGRLNLQINYLYQSPHQLFHNLLYFLNVLNGTVLYCKYMNIFCFILYCSLYLALI